MKQSESANSFLDICSNSCIHTLLPVRLSVCPPSSLCVSKYAYVFECMLIPWSFRFLFFVVILAFFWGGGQSLLLRIQNQSSRKYAVMISTKQQPLTTPTSTPFFLIISPSKRQKQTFRGENINSARRSIAYCGCCKLAKKKLVSFFLCT